SNKGSVDGVGHQASSPLTGSSSIHRRLKVNSHTRSSSIDQNIGLPSAVVGVALHISLVADHAQQHLGEFNTSQIAVRIELLHIAFLPATHVAQVGAVVDVALSPVAYGNIGILRYALESNSAIIDTVVLQN